MNRQSKFTDSISKASEPHSKGPRGLIGHILLLPLCLLFFGCASESKPFTCDFADSTVGTTPVGFSTALTGGGGEVSWKVREDPSAPPPHRLVVQESQDDTSYRFPMCICEGSTIKDVAVEVKFKALLGKTDQAGGIVLRYTPENYYIARANALEDNVNLFKTINGNRIKIEEVDAKVAPNQWHTLRFEAKGNELTVIFDGKTVIKSHDDAITNAGKIGLWTKADSVSAFAELHVEPLK